MSQLCFLIFYIALLMRIDRHFLKKNSSFCIHFIQQQAGIDTLPPLSIEEESLLDSLLKEPFTYLSKGNSCYAFISQDRKRVLKFHRIPSHKRIAAFLFNPSSYFLDKKKKRMGRLKKSIESYTSCHTDLKQETGCLWLQAQPRPSLKKKALLIDKAKNRYELDLSNTVFIVQEAAKLVFPTLQELINKQELDLAKCAITHILQLLSTTFLKGYIHKDPVLQTNFGLLPDRAIFIDMGDISFSASSQNRADYLKSTTYLLYNWLQEQQQSLAEHYNAEMKRLL